MREKRKKQHIFIWSDWKSLIDSLSVNFFGLWNDFFEVLWNLESLASTNRGKHFPPFQWGSVISQYITTLFRALCLSEKLKINWKIKSTRNLRSSEKKKSAELRSVQNWERYKKGRRRFVIPNFEWENSFCPSLRITLKQTRKYLFVEIIPGMEFLRRNEATSENTWTQNTLKIQIIPRAWFILGFPIELIYGKQKSCLAEHRSYPIEYYTHLEPLNLLIDVSEQHKIRLLTAQKSSNVGSGYATVNLQLSDLGNWAEWILLYILNLLLPPPPARPNISKFNTQHKSINVSELHTICRLRLWNCGIFGQVSNFRHLPSKGVGLARFNVYAIKACLIPEYTDYPQTTWQIQGETEKREDFHWLGIDNNFRASQSNLAI